MNLSVPQCGNDDTFGPIVLSDCRGGFDFTLLFEQAFLLTLPCVLMLLAVPWRIVHLFKTVRKTRRNFIEYIKLFSVCAFSCQQLALVVVWVVGPATLRTNASVPASFFSFLSSVALVLLSSFEHRRSVRPSFIINVYLLFSLLFDIVVARTMWLGATQHKIAAVFTSGIAIKVAMLFLEASEKRKYLKEAFSQLPPEGIAGILNRSLFWWLNALFQKGFSGIISHKDLYDLDEILSSKSSHLRANILRDRIRQGRKHRLFLALTKQLGWPLLNVILPRLCLIAFTYTQPALINKIVQFAREPPNSGNIGYGLIGASFFVYCGIAVSNVHANHAFNRVLIMIRGTLISSIYEKMLHLRSDSPEQGSAITLMSTDIDRICTVLEQVNSLWAGLIEVSIAFWLLAREVGVAATAPLGLGIVAALVTSIISGKSPAYQQAWFRAIEKRVAATSDVLRSIKAIKMMGLTPLVSKVLQDLRTQEINLSKGFRWFNISLNVVVNSQLVFFPVLVLGIFSTISIAEFTVSKAFTTLSIVALLSGPLIEILANTYLLTSAATCFDRIQTFLLLPDRVDQRTIRANGLRQDTEMSGHSISDNVISITSSDIGARVDGTSILKGINMNVRVASLTILTGPTGSGKSTLLRGLLGESSVIDGSISLAASKAAYCSDEPWLTNDTISTNIIGGASLDSEWFETVVQVCGFDHELRALVSDDIKIGSMGMILSGGQRQRVALARAIYSKEKVLVLDNPFSGLDSHTEAKILNGLFGRRGLLKVGGITVILATNANKIIALDREGRIDFEGTLNEFKKRGFFPKAARIETLSSSIASSSQNPTIATDTRPPVPRGAPTAPEDDSRRTGDISAYKYYLLSLGHTQTFCFAVLVALRVFCVQYPQIWVKQWAQANEITPGKDKELFMGVYISFAAAALCFVGGSLWQMFIVIIPRSAGRLHAILLSAVMKAPYLFHFSTDMGITLNRFSQDMSLIDSQLPSAFLQTSTAVAGAIGGAILIAAGSKFMAITILPCLIILYALQKFYLRLSRQIRLMDIEAKSPLFTHFSETSNGLETIRAFGWQERHIQQCLHLLDYSQKPVYLLLCIQRWLGLALDLLIAALAIILVTLAVKLSGSTNSGSVGVALISILGFNQVLAQAITSYTALETSIGAIVRIKSFVTTTGEESDPSTPKTPSLDWPTQGTIEFQKVMAAYSSDGPLVFQNLSLSIPARQNVAICGRSGSGKSSMVLLLARLLDHSSGSITIDDIPIDQISRERSRSSLTILPQDPVMIPGTVRLNADPSSTKSDEEIMMALRSVGLGDIFISNEVLDMPVENIPLSKGQRQLFSVAYASLRESNVVVLDEATSNLDGESEAIVQDIILRKWRDKTVLAIVHHMSMVLDYDKVAVVDAGRVVEYGSPRDLLSQRDSWFRSLWDASLQT